MAKSPPLKGCITTFFSYKGGVGRSMALANVGFLAALAGKRVLLMDWDLEAPGLHVYFRGITDPASAGDIRKAKGVLDLFVDWREDMAAAGNAGDVTKAAQRFRGGKPFKDIACPLIPARRLPKGACLDIIGAGGTIVGEDPPLPYAEALSHFVWSDFFTEYAGGALLEALRKWCAKNYDVILLDSRTGLADVAGICTMQIPDQVLLCFVLNRQNTEGVADIARAIRNTRGDEIAIRVAPMRVSKDRPTEEADARARAQRELRRAGLDAELLDTDMSLLSIATASNIPFYETLAPFAATSPSADPLTFEYLRMTQEICGKSPDLSRIDASWIEEVRRRLQPRMTTADYLESLETADPDRGIDELDRFLDGAIDADPSRELDVEYVQALIDTVFQANNWFWNDENSDRLAKLCDKALALLRHLHMFGDGDWRLMLVDAMDEFNAYWGQDYPQTEAERTAASDEVLADGPQSADIVLRRSALRIAGAHELSVEPRQGPAINRLLAQSEDLLSALPYPLDAEDANDAQLQRADIASLRAERAAARRPAEAVDYWRQAIAHLSGTSGERRSRGADMLAEAHLGIARITARSDPAAAVDEVLRAVQCWPQIMFRDIENLENAIAMIAAVPNADALANEFSVTLFGRGGEHRLHFGPGSRTISQTGIFAHLLEQLVTLMASGRKRHREGVHAAAAAAEQQLQRATHLLSRMRGPNIPTVARAASEYQLLLESLDAAGASEAVLDTIRMQLVRLQTVTRRAQK